jgi:threonine dehydratase
MGLEIVEEAPDAAAVVAAIGGGGLISGVGSAVKALRPEVRVLGAEPETAAPFALSLREGGPRRFPGWQPSFVDGAGGKSVTERMWERMTRVADGAVTVTLEETRQAMRLMAERRRVIIEGAAACAVAVALAGKAGGGKVVCVVSGGNIDLATFCELVAENRRPSEGWGPGG